MPTTTELPVEPSPRAGEYKSIADKLGEARVIMDNMTLADIAAIVKPMGYDTPQYTEGKRYFSLCEQRIADQSKETGESHSATETSNRFRAELEHDVKIRFKLAKIAFENNYAARDSLKLDERRKTTTSEWYVQQKTYYLILLANASFIAGLSQFGISEGLLEEDMARLDQLGKLISLQQKEFGDSTTATTLRDLALEQLFDWLDRYKKVAKIALGEYPEYRDKLGI